MTQDTPAPTSPRVDAFKVTVDAGMRLREGEWDGGRAERELRAWATDGDKTDWRKAARGYVVFDLDPTDRDPNQSDGKLPIAYVENGELVGIGNAIRNALSRLPQTEGLSEAVQSEAKATLERMLERLNEADGDGMKPKGDTPEPAAQLPLNLDEGAVWRWSRMDVTIDERTRCVIDRALELTDRGDKADAASIQAIGEQLRADGFDDKLTPERFLIIDLLAARTGAQIYSDGRDQWGEFRPDAEVEASLKSYALRPFTDDHPPVMVTGDNYTQYVKGAVGQDAVLEPPHNDGYRYVRVSALIGDAATLRKIRDGKAELSAGYTTVPVADNGEDVNGVGYRFRQTRININHLALVDRGRAGPLARINIDGAAWEVAPTGETMTQDKDTKDMIDPESAMALIKMLMQVMHGEMAPEAKAEMMAQLSALTGLDVEALTEMLKAAMMPAEPAPEEPETMDVEIADGLTVKMTEDQKAAWEAKQAKTKTDAAEAATLKQDLAAQAGQIAGLQSQVKELTDATQRAEQGSLRRDIAEVCPQLAASWAKKIDDGEFDLNRHQMMADCVLDLDPELKPDVEAARKNADTFPAYIESLYKTTTRSAARRKRDSATPPAANPSTVFSVDDLNQQAAAYLNRPN